MPLPSSKPSRSILELVHFKGNDWKRVPRIWFPPLLRSKSVGNPKKHKKYSGRKLVCPSLLSSQSQLLTLPNSPSGPSSQQISGRSSQVSGCDDRKKRSHPSGHRWAVDKTASFAFVLVFGGLIVEAMERRDEGTRVFKWVLTCEPLGCSVPSFSNRPNWRQVSRQCNQSDRRQGKDFVCRSKPQVWG